MNVTVPRSTASDWIQTLGQRGVLVFGIFRQGEVAEVQRAIRTHDGAHDGSLERDVLEHERPLPQRRQLEIDEQACEAEHRLCIGVGQRQVAHLELQLERVHAHLADLQLATVVLADEAGSLVTDDAGRDLEAEQGVQAEQRCNDRKCDERPGLENGGHSRESSGSSENANAVDSARHCALPTAGRLGHFSLPSQRYR